MIGSIRRRTLTLAALSVLFGGVLLLSLPGLSSDKSVRAQPALSSAAKLTAFTDFSCRLPVSGPGQAGFLVMPTRAMVAEPGIKPTGGMLYSATGGWVSGLQRQSSPDGRSFAVADPRAGSVSIAGKSPSLQRSIPANVQDVIGWTDAGIFAWSARLDQVWVINPADGSHHSFSAHQLSFESATATGVWSLSRGGVWRMDPVTGQVKQWYTFTAGPSGNRGGSLLGFDAIGSPVVFDEPNAASGGWQVVVLSSPGTVRVVASSSTNPGFTPLHALGDTHGLWFTTTTGSVWLETSGGLGPIGGSNAFVIAGPCN